MHKTYRSRIVVFCFNFDKWEYVKIQIMSKLWRWRGVFKIIFWTKQAWWPTAFISMLKSALNFRNICNYKKNAIKNKNTIEIVFKKSSNTSYKPCFGYRKQLNRNWFRSLKCIMNVREKVLHRNRMGMNLTIICYLHDEYFTRLRDLLELGERKQAHQLKRPC